MAGAIGVKGRVGKDHIRKVVRDRKTLQAKLMSGILFGVKRESTERREQGRNMT